PGPVIPVHRYVLVNALVLGARRRVAVIDTAAERPPPGALLLLRRDALSKDRLAPFELVATGTHDALVQILPYRSPPPVHGHGTLHLVACHIWPRREEPLRLVHRTIPRIVDGDRDEVANRQRVDDAHSPATLACNRGPVNVQTPPHFDRGKRQQHAEHVTVESRERPDLHEDRFAHDTCGTPSGNAPGRVRAVAVRGLRQFELEPLGEENEAVEKTPRQRNVVVHRQHPSETRNGALGEQGIEVTELPAPPADAEGYLDLVARASQLGERPLHEHATVRTNRAEDQDATRGRRPARRPRQAQLLERGEPPEVFDGIAEGG